MANNWSVTQEVLEGPNGYHKIPLKWCLKKNGLNNRGVLFGSANEGLVTERRFRWCDKDLQDCVAMKDQLQLSLLAADLMDQFRWLSIKFVMAKTASLFMGLDTYHFL